VLNAYVDDTIHITHLQVTGPIFAATQDNGRVDELDRAQPCPQREALARRRHALEVGGRRHVLCRSQFRRIKGYTALPALAAALATATAPVKGSVPQAISA